jgi:hypothetical protein
LNPVLARGQVEGSVYMGLGEALMEEQTFRRLPPRLSHALVHKFPSMLEYKSPTSLDMPEVDTELIEHPDPRGPFGAKEVGQGPLLPIMPAVANAVTTRWASASTRSRSPRKDHEGAGRQGEGEAGRYGPGAFPDIAYPSRCSSARRGKAATATPSTTRAQERRAKLEMMRLPLFKYMAPKTAHEGAGSSRTRAGRGDGHGGRHRPLPNMKRRQQTPEDLVSLAHVDELRHARTANGMVLGAGLTLTRARGRPADQAALRGLFQAASRSRRPPAQHGNARRQHLPRHALQLLRPETTSGGRRSAFA